MALKGSTVGMGVGAAAGSIIPGVGTMLGAGIGGAVGGMFDNNNAAKDAAEAMQRQAEEWARYVKQQQERSVGMVMTPSAIAAHDQNLASAESNVRRQEALVASLDPNIIEAGKQTAQLLQGHAAPVLQNLTQQRQLQRDQLRQQLVSQMGPGAETSTAGQQALNQFDQQTSNIMNGAQQEYLDKVSNMSLGGAATLGQTLNQVNSTLAQVNEAGPQNRAAQLISQFTNGAGAQAQNAMFETAGGQFIGDQLKSQQEQNLSNALIQGGAAMLGNKSMQSPGTGTTKPAEVTPDGTGSGFTQDEMAADRARQAGYAAGGIWDGPAKPGTLASSVAPPRIPSAPSNLPFSSGYGGAYNAASDRAYNMSPTTSPLSGRDFTWSPPQMMGNVGGGQ